MAGEVPSIISAVAAKNSFTSLLTKKFCLSAFLFGINYGIKSYVQYLKIPDKRKFKSLR